MNTFTLGLAFRLFRLSAFSVPCLRVGLKKLELQIEILETTDGICKLNV